MKKLNTSLTAVAATVLMIAPLTSFAFDLTPFGKVLNLTLHPEQLSAFSIEYTVPVTGGLIGAGTCPAIPTKDNPAQFTDANTFNFVGTNDLVHFYKSVKNKNVEVLQISHARIDNHTTYTPSGPNPWTRDIYVRQDWTRIKDNPNGIDNTSGIRHYIGNFSEENQRDANGVNQLTGNSIGVATLAEPLVFMQGSGISKDYANLATEVNMINFIGPQVGWLEPFSVADARTCLYLKTGIPQSADPAYSFTCQVGDNIVGCPATAVTPECHVGVDC